MSSVPRFLDLCVCGVVGVRLFVTVQTEQTSLPKFPKFEYGKLQKDRKTDTNRQREIKPKKIYQNA
jgi:hypothetical protein